jgi:hypothetical protein
MMSEPFDSESVSDELLSAYLDGELPPQQAARIEQWVSGSESARRRLEDFRRLSGWLRDLPRAELPSEFASQVLREAERQMLLPAAAPRPTLARRVRWWALAVLAPVSAAAVLFVAVLLFRAPDRQPPDLAQRDDQPLAARQEAATAMAAPPAEASQKPVAAKMSIASRASGVAGGRQATVSAEGQSAEGQSADSARPAPVATPMALQPELDESTMAAGESEEIDAAQVALLVRRARKINDAGKTAVVRLYVIDRREGMELVQVVLDENQIPREDPPAAFAGKADRKPESEAAAPLAAPPAAARSAVASAPGAGREGLFVVADVEKLTTALESLRMRQEGAVTWTLADSIDLDALDRPSRQRVDQALMALAAGPAEQRVMPSKGIAGEAESQDERDSSAAKSAPALAARAAPNAKRGRPPAGLMAARSAKAPPGEPTSPARQVLVKVASGPFAAAPGKAAAKKSGEGASPSGEERPGQLSRKAAPPPENGADRLAERSAAPESRPGLVRLILLIESKAPAARPAAPALPAAPGDGDGDGNV